MCPVFERWLRSGICFEDIGAVDVLLMDMEWHRDAGDQPLFAMLERLNPSGTLQRVLRQASQGSALPQFARFATYRCTSVPQERAKGSRGLNENRWLQRGDQSKLWSQHGSQSHWDRIAMLVEHVDSRAAAGFRVSPDRVVLDIERFATDKGRWLKIAGGLKAEVMDWVFLKRPQHDAEVLVELGTFIGYTAIRLGCSICRSYLHTPVMTLEIDPLQACIARHFVNLAGLARCVEVCIGQVRDLLPRLVEDFGSRSMSFAFLDYKGNAFHEDMGSIERLGLACPAAHSLADNTVSPGCPLYVWRMAHSTSWSLTAWCVEEFLEPEQEDWMLMSELQRPTAGEPGPAAPASWCGLAWTTEHIRRRAEGMRPAEGFLSAGDRAAFAQLVRCHYTSFGIEAIPWSLRDRANAVVAKP